MTNEQIVQSQWTTKELAEALVKRVSYEEFDYDWEENLVSNGIADYYVTSDGGRFDFYEEAVGHEIWWLKQETAENDIYKKLPDDDNLVQMLREFCAIQQNGKTKDECVVPKSILRMAADRIEVIQSAISKLCK